MEKGTTGQIYHLSPDAGVTVKEVVATICKHLGTSLEKASLIAPERLGQDKAYVIDSTKARKLGWKPTISLDTGLMQTINWVNEHYEELGKMPLGYIHKE
jgi:dTDP-glucose 4,6-dehydratase